MMDDITLEREDDPRYTNMSLNDEEQAMLDDMEISTERNIDIFPARKAPNFKPKKKSAGGGGGGTGRAAQREEPEINAFMNPTKGTAAAPAPRRRRVVSSYEEPEEEPLEDELPEDEPEDDQFGGDSGDGEPSAGYASIDDEKADILNKLTRLEKKGLQVNKKLNAYSSISELRVEYKRVTYSIEVDSSIRFSRKMLVACVSGLEFVNKRYNPVDIYLDGWSESIVENLDDYDTVFEELYNKYKTKMEVAPEVKMIMMLGGSAMMFHLTNSMFKAAIPNMNDVLKNNPDLVKNMVSAVQNSGKQQGQGAATASPSSRYEMRGPGLDIGGLMSGIMMPPPPPVSTSRLQAVVEDIDGGGGADDVSDIVSVSGESTGGEVREVHIPKKRGRKSTKKNVVSM